MSPRYNIVLWEEYEQRNRETELSVGLKQTKSTQSYRENDVM